MKKKIHFSSKTKQIKENDTRTMISNSTITKKDDRIATQLYKRYVIPILFAMVIYKKSALRVTLQFAIKYQILLANRKTKHLA